MKEERLALIRYRLKQTEESLAEAKVLQEQGMSLRSVMNRLYYAMYYAVLALLQEKRLGTSKHIGAISLFDREFIKTGLLDRDLSRTLHRAFELRQKGDYFEEAEITKENLAEMFPKARDFVEKINEYLQKER